MAVITLNGSPLHTIGSLPAIGMQAPDFNATKTDLTDITLKNYFGKKIILNIFPSLDTSTCASTMHKFNELATQLSEVTILCVSEDLPFAQKRFCTNENLKNILPVSVFRHPEFGENYGVMIIDGPLTGVLSRAIVVINEDGKILHTEQVMELSNEPDYTGILSALKNSDR